MTAMAKRLMPDDGSGVRQIPLTRGLVALVDAADFELVGNYNWHAVPSNPPGRFYAVRGTRVGGKYRNIFMHNQLMGVEPSIAKAVDHKNHDGLDNRRENLRISDRYQNMRNRRKLKPGTSKYKGVCFVSTMQTWEAKIAAGPVQRNGKRKQLLLGRFSSEAEAARAYDAAATEHFGEFAVLNGA